MPGRAENLEMKNKNSDSSRKVTSLSLLKFLGHQLVLRKLSTCDEIASLVQVFAHLSLALRE
jgi:hypothetical protein